jgi:hypothetical protein
MFSKILKKWTFPLVLCAAMLLGGVGNLHAFSVDVKGLGYVDYSNPTTARRVVNYDFSGGTIGATDNTITLPAGAVPTQPPIDGNLTYTFGPYPDPENAVAVSLDTTSAKSTLTVASENADGGCIINTTAPPSSPPVPQWTYSVKLSNFASMTDDTKTYSVQIGMASMISGPHPEFTLSWVPGESGRSLGLNAKIYDDNLEQTLWQSSSVTVPGFSASTDTILLRIRNLDPNEGGNSMIFDYSVDNGVNWVVVGTLTFPFTISTVPPEFPHVSFPGKFPFVSLWFDSGNGGSESPFRVSSQHWKDNMGTGNSYYDAWLTVEDPGQTTYSGITVTSSGAEQVLSGTALAYNPAGGYWEIPAQRFSDNFDDNTLDATKWTTQGSAVTETGGMLQVAQTVTDDIAKALSRDIAINPYAPIVVQRKAYVHAANQYFNGVLALYFGANADVSQQTATFSVIASHAAYSYDDAETSPANGFYIGRYAAHLSPAVTLATAAVWDAWFDEKISYNPVSGVADLYINNELKATYNVGALPAGANHMKVYLDAWGWNTGHYNYSDDLTVTQPWVGQPVRLISNSDTPPADPVTFTFEATKKAGGTETLVQPVTGYVTDFATNLQPTGSVDTNPIFSWTGVTGASAYSVEVSDAMGNRVWNKYDIPSTTTSYPYGGPALTNGQTYSYFIEAGINTDGQHNSSFAQGSFTYNAGGTTPIAIPGTASVGTDLSLTYTMHPPTGFTFATGVVASMSPETPGDFGITGYEGNEAPYSAYGFLNPTVTGIQDLGVTTLDAVTEIPNTGYTLPPALSLTAGHAYAFTLAGGYGVIAVKSVTLNLPSVTMVFDYKYWGTTAGTIAFNGWVNTVPDWPATTNIAAVTGAQVSSYLAGSTVPIGTVTADATTGAFSLTGIPKSQTFFLRVQPPTGYMPVLSKVMNWTADIQALLPFVLFTTDQFAGFGNEANTSMIVGRVALTSETPPATTFLSGATIVATQVVNGVPTATTYPVTYNSATNSTGADGVYMVKNVPSGTVVQLVATLAGHTFPFNGAYVPVAADAVSEESFFAMAIPPTPSPFYSYSYHQPNGGDYFINLFAEDPTHAFTGGVTVSGPFLTGGTASLVYNDVSKRWELPAGAGGMNLGSTLPTGGPYSYYFEAKIGETVAKSETNVISVFVEGYATPSSPTGTVTLATPTFTWAAVSGATGYSIVLKDTTAGTDVWFTPILPSSQTSIVYNGPIPLVSGHAYEYTVIALNDSDGNQNSSFALGSFTYAAACTYALDPTSKSTTAAGGSATVSVTAGADCTWTAVSNNTDWLHVTFEGWTASGNGTVGYTFDTNTGAARTGTMTIAGQTFTVIQAASVEPHPEAETIASRFAEAINLIKAGNFTGFAGYISENFLDYGENKALFLAELQQETGALEYTIQSITGTGDLAVMNLTWSDGELDTLYFKKEGDVWMWYGNQHLFDAWANSSHEMYSTNPYPYWVNLSVEDPDPEAFPGLTITSVKVTGTDLPAEGIPLSHDTTSGQWNSWMSEAAQPYLRWATTPDVPRAYTLEVNYTGTYKERTSPEVYTYPVMAFVEVAPLQESLSPASGSTAARPLVFSWNSNNFGPGYNYRVQVSDSGHNWIWESEESTTGTSLAYAGPFLPAGSYYYYLYTRDGYDNMSMIQVPFMMPPLKGDLNGDNKVDLADAVLALRILGGFSPTSGLRADYAASGTDVNGDNKAGLAELEFILQSAAGLRLQ